MSKQEKMYYVFLIMLAGLSIIPLIVLCKYNHPSADDFGYSVATFHEWNQSHSLLKVLYAAVDTSKNFYNSWQGLYSSAFFLALQPGIFGEKYYALTGVIMIFVIVFSICFFFAYITKRVIGASVLEGIVVGGGCRFFDVTVDAFLRSRALLVQRSY